MKKIIRTMTAGVITLALLAGCGDSSGETVALDGSTSMEKVVGYLSEAYMEENETVKVTYNPTGSGAGITAAAEGRCDIGLSSRELKEEEKETLIGTVVAIDGIAMIVNPQNPVSDLTISQIAKIYKGEIKSWKDVGGEDTPIVCIGREAASGTRDGFESITETEDACVYTQELTSTGDVVQTVASNPNAIGYASLASVKETVKTLAVEGISPAIETIQDGSYKIQRDFILVTKKEGLTNEAAKKFYEFCISETADMLVTKAGAVPVKR